MKRVACALAMIVFGAVGIVAATAGATEATPRCRHVSTAVRLAPDDPATYRVAGRLCGTGHIVQVLAHGASYDSGYWFGPGPARYSYVTAATRAGYTTLALDLPGAGASAHPDPALVDFTAIAYVLHQVVTRLRDGTLGRYRAVVGVGHSMGAGAWIMEAGEWHDVDALVLADFLHEVDPVAVATIRSLYRPAEGLPAGYLTIPDRSFFYNTAYARPWVIAADRPTTFTLRQVVTLPDARDPARSRAIHVPVLLATGQMDALGCSAALSCVDAGAVADREQPYFTICVAAFVLPRAGHDINLHPDAPAFFARADSFIRTALR